MSETPENPFEGLDISPAEMPGDEIVKPQPDIPEDISEQPETDKPLSPAQRLKARFSQTGAGRAAGEPSTGDAAPRASRAKEKERLPKPREGSLVKPLTDMYTSVGLMIAPFDPACSVAFIENAHSCAVSMEKLARENEAVRRVINSMMQTSAWGSVLIAHLPILLMVMMHHGPREMQDRIAPMAMMMNPAAMQKAAEAQAEAERSAEENAA